MSTQIPKDFRDFILRDYEARKKQSPKLNLRKYAEFLGFSPQKLNQVLKKKSGISPATAIELAAKFNLNTSEKEFFVALVESNHHRSKILREQAVKKLKSLQSELDFEQLKIEEFNPVSEWYCMAACLLVDLEGFQPDMKWAAKKLGISVEVATQTFEKLFDFGFLRKAEDGRWVRDSKKISIAAKGASKKMQNYHRQLIAKADEAHAKPLSERYFSNAMVSVSQDDIEMIKSKIDNFRREIITEISESSNVTNRIFNLSIQLYGLDQPEIEIK